MKFYCFYNKNPYAIIFKCDTGRLFRLEGIMTVAELIKQLERYDMKQTVRVFDITEEALVDIEEVAENVAGGDVVIWCED
jgi:hypothetical protein